VPQLYRLHDSDETLKRKGALPVASLDEATEWNREGWGIFQTVNSFKGPRRIENLTAINAWALDLDAGTKDGQWQRIENGPLIPSLIVETKRGFQVYFNAKDAKPEHWNAIVLDRLVPYYGADANARDLARILRAPDFWHLKDPKDPFLVRVIHRRAVSYSEQQVALRYPDIGSRERAAKQQAQAKRVYRDPMSGESLWDAIYQLDCEEALSRLSGHPAVGGEQYTFRRVGSGNLNLIVDGKTTSCWVDKQKRIGSLARGGPSVTQWLRWFGVEYRDIAKIMKQLFPHLERCK
jgi:hypothetical protein